MRCLLVIVAALIFPTGAIKTLPLYIKPCARLDPKFNECAVKHGNEAIPHVAKGDQKYKIPVLDPLDLKEVKVVQDEQRPVGIALTLRNAKVHGLKDTVLRKADINFDRQHTFFEGTVPLVHIIGQYEMSGRILVQPINGIGDITLILRNVHMTFDEDWKFIPRDGEKYVFIENVTSSVVPGSVNVNITNLFGGNKLLGDQMNIFLNENWKQLFKDLSPVIFKIFAEVLASSLNTITTEIPFDTMFPERIPQ